jgi:uncharacterized integral membrane protein
MKYVIMLSIIMFFATFPSLAIVEPGTEDSAAMVVNNDSNNDKIVIVLPPGFGQSEVVISRSSTGKNEALPEDMQLLGVNRDNVMPGNNSSNDSKDLPDDMKEILANKNSSVSSSQNGVHVNVSSTGSGNKVATSGVTDPSKNDSSVTKMLWFIMITFIVLLILLVLYMSFSHKKNIVSTEKI